LVFRDVEMTLAPRCFNDETTEPPRNPEAPITSIDFKINAKSFDYLLASAVAFTC
jgi:hypothetical protein